MEYLGLLQATSSHSTTTNALQSVSDNTNFLDVLLLNLLFAAHGICNNKLYLLNLLLTYLLTYLLTTAAAITNATAAAASVVAVHKSVSE